MSGGLPRPSSIWAFKHSTMKKLLPLLALFGAACQPQSSTSTPVAVARTVPPAVAAPTAPLLPSPFKATDTLTAPMRQLLAQCDLSKLWQGATEGPGSTSVLEGFFGPDHYRFELALTAVRRDAQNPALYHVRGKCHYRKNVRPFTGSLLVREVNKLEPPYEFDYDDKDSPNESWATQSEAVRERKLQLARPSEALAELRLKEENAPNSGELVGKVTLLFYLTSHHRPAHLWAPLRGTDSYTNAGYLLIQGTRYNVTTRQTKKFVVADNVFTAAPDALKDFGIGDRGGEINPKYAHLGWNEKWENDEWWADSPKPRLSL